jgi:hypothetical protein
MYTDAGGTGRTTCIGMKSWASAGAASGEKGLEKLGLSTLLTAGADFDD